jgi:hypothetical protein
MNIFNARIRYPPAVICAPAGGPGAAARVPMEKDEGGGGFGKLLAIHLLYSFIAAAMAVMVPIYMVEREIDIAHIGLILSLGPLAFTAIRLIFAGMADDVGTKAISVIYSAANMVAVELYLLFLTPFGFIAATLSEGVRTAGFWAIARADVLSAPGIKEPGRLLARFSNLRQLADGLGRLAIGFIIAYLAFTGAFVLILVLSLAMLALVVSSKGEGALGFRVGRSTLAHIMKHHPASFWKASLLQLLIWLPCNMLVAFLIPIYLVAELKLPYEQVGAILALLSLASAAFALLFVRMKLSNHTLMLMTLLGVPALVLLPMLGTGGLFLLVLVAVTFGCCNIVSEYILVDVVFRSKDVSSDIGVLYLPLKVAEFLFLSIGGLAIAAFGFAPLFYALALSTGLYVVLGSALIPHKSSSAAARPAHPPALKL